MAPNDLASTNLAPSKLARDAQKKIKESDLAIDNTIQALNFVWDLRLRRPGNNESPQHRNPGMENKCVFMITFICRKASINAVRLRFQEKAEVLYSGWVNKQPQADRGVLPTKTRANPHPVTDDERHQLLFCLHEILVDEFEPLKAVEKTKRTPRKDKDLDRELDDTPVPFPYGQGSNEKRTRTGGDAENSLNSKRPRRQDSPSLEEMPPPANANANTSFTSNFSRSESIFSRQDSSLFTSTQSTIPDEEPVKLPVPPPKETRKAFTNPQEDKAKSSDYGSSFDTNAAAAVVEDLVNSGKEIPTPERGERDPQAEEALSRDLLEVALGGGETVNPREAEFSQKLHEVFFDQPSSLRSASFRSVYEITRVFLHAGLPLAAIRQFPRRSDLDDYDKLWRFLENLPALKGRTFPERSEVEVWKAAAGVVSQDDFPDVVYSGALHFNDSPTEPLFNFRLHPMKFDRSHRLSRRFGSDRFLEIDIPQLTGRGVPKALQDLEDRGPDIIHSWLVDPKYQRSTSGHPIFGRYWKPFFVKPQERRNRRKEADQATAANRLLLFAIDGPGLAGKDRPKMDMLNLLDSIRPTTKNGHQSFLKLFARNALVVSRTRPTVTLEQPEQIIRLPDLKCGGEEMTDGAGRISPSLALKVVAKLNISYLPSGFQGRIGEAKGFWTVDHRSERRGDWIKIYKSQCKWTPEDEDAHPTSRTFEVLRYSAPLRSADLNLQFLPLLVERARDQRAMQNTLAQLLEDGLKLELELMQSAMTSSESFRKWLRENNNSIDERLKSQGVSYKAGLPAQIHERLNALIDSGFDPSRTWIIKDIAKDAFKNKCEELEDRLNITVGKSAYAYMVPDFWEVLEEGEVYIDFSSFIDSGSRVSGVSLNRKDVLVARSPANYASDIQKAKVVFREALIELKDVIIFPTKGNPSLATKLSGGDYDGDIAWVCWEESIVSNFESVEVPKCPDLVKEGLIRQNKTSYNELVKDSKDPTSTFLKESLAFNMQQSMLGICTSYKDNVVYTKGRYDTREAVYLSTLLSNLVDQQKQGYIFTEDDWGHFKDKIVPYNVKVPPYKKEKDKKKKVLDRRSEWIIDKLMYLAHKAVGESLHTFSVSSNPPYTDPDLVVIYNWAKGHKEKEWKDLVKNLDADISQLREAWKEDSDERRAAASFANKRAGSFADDSFDESAGEYMAIVERQHAQLQRIMPRDDTPFTQGLLVQCQPDRPEPEFSTWALLRASALFRSFKGPSRTPWLVAGRQLCALKTCHGIGNGTPVMITPRMYAMLKPDAAYVKRLKTLEVCGVTIDEGASVVDADEVESLREDF